MQPVNDFVIVAGNGFPRPGRFLIFFQVLKKFDNVLSQFRPDPGNFLQGGCVRLPDFFQGAKVGEQGCLFSGADARAIVEQTFGDAALHQELVIAVGHSMGFVADALQKPDGSGILVENQGVGFPGTENFLPLFRQADNGERFAAEALKFTDGTTELALSTVDNDEVGERLMFADQAAVTAANHFGHGSEIILAADLFDSVATVVVAVRFSVSENDHGSHFMGGGDVGDVEAFDVVWRCGETESFLQFLQIFPGCDGSGDFADEAALFGSGTR